MRLGVFSVWRTPQQIVQPTPATTRTVDRRRTALPTCHTTLHCMSCFDHSAPSISHHLLAVCRLVRHRHAIWIACVRRRAKCARIAFAFTNAGPLKISQPCHKREISDTSGVPIALLDAAGSHRGVSCLTCSLADEMLRPVCTLLSLHNLAFYTA